MASRGDKVLPGFQSPAAGFEQPFELLAACHERVQRTLDLLTRLQAHLAQHGCDQQARQAALDVMRYFDIAAPLHHQDEELHVFPPLLRLATPEVKKLVRQLQIDHIQMASWWVRARAVLQTVAQYEPGRSPAQWQPLTSAQTGALHDFAALYVGHIEREEQVAYPQARLHLPADALQVMQADMMQRRGVKPQVHNNSPRR